VVRLPFIGCAEDVSSTSSPLATDTSHFGLYSHPHSGGGGGDNLLITITVARIAERHKICFFLQVQRSSAMILRSARSAIRAETLKTHNKLASWLFMLCTLLMLASLIGPLASLQSSREPRLSFHSG